MKKSTIILGSLVLAAIAGGTYLTRNSQNNTIAKYESKSLDFSQAENKTTAKWNQAKEHWDQLHANKYTGQVEEADYIAAYNQVMNMPNSKAATMTFAEMGPDNVGGRTRGIAIHPTNDNLMYAGSVSGGLFKTTNGGNNWTKVAGWKAPEVPTTAIGSITITGNGTVYVGTGLETVFSEGGTPKTDAEGIWFSTDGGATWAQVAGTSNKEVYKLERDKTKSNTFYYLSGSGQYLKRCENCDGSSPNITTINSSNGLTSAVSKGQDVKVSPDGKHILYMGVSKAYISHDSGNSFTQITDVPNGIGRIEGAISHEKTSAGKYTMYMVLSTGSGEWGGALMSEDNGVNWTIISPKYSNPNNLPFNLVFNPLNSGGTSPQGRYGLVCSVVKGDPYSMILGGVDLYRWTKTPGSSPINGQFERISFWFLNPSNPSYVHADNHRLTWTNSGRMVIGNDGGINISLDASMTIFTAANRGYNVTQYYAMAYGPDDEVIGGAQDNGTTYNNNMSLSGKSFVELTGGDGFETELSQLKNGAFVSSVYFASVSRGDAGSGVGGVQNVSPPCGAGVISQSCGSFATYLRLFEDINDTDTQDSITYIANESMSIGDIVTYTSSNFDIPLSYALTQNIVVTFDTTYVLSGETFISPDYLDTIVGPGIWTTNPVAQDTIQVPNYVQTLFAVKSGTGVYLTRDIFKFSKTPDYTKILNTTNATKFEFSKDGNTLWVGTSTGMVLRVNGLDSAYIDEQMNIDSALTSVYVLDIDTMATQAGGQMITDISVSSSDPNKVAYTAGGSGGNNIFYSSNAMSATPTFAVKDGNLPSYVVFGCELINDPTGDIKMIVGTEFGAYGTENNLSGSVQWDPLINETGVVPVTDVRQQWRPWGGEVKNPGVVYLGTFGRGIWKSDDVVGLNEIEGEDIEDVQLSNLIVYPNPLSDNGSIKFELGISSDVEINIYNLQGKIVRTMNTKNISKGEHSISFNASEFAAGTYIVSLTANGSREITKFIVR